MNDIGDFGLGQIARIKKLEYLDLSGTKITDAGLDHLSRLERLTTVHLRDTTVSDIGLKKLHGLKQLRELGLDGTKVTKEGVLELRKNLPNLRVTAFGSVYERPHSDTDKGKGKKS